MKFCELTESEFRTFSSNHPLTSYLQTPELAKSKEEDGWKYYYVGVKENKEILCATLLLEWNGRFFKSFSSPRGYLIDFRDKELLVFFTKGIKKFVKEKKGAFLNIEPKILYKERDSEGKIVENGFDNTDIYNNLINTGYKHNGFYLELDSRKQVRWAYVLNLKNKSEDEIFNGFKSTTRNSIRKAIKYGVKVRELEFEELAIFKKMVDDSGAVKGFFKPELSYYEKMYRIFKPLNQICFLIAELNVEDYIANLEREIEEYKNKIANLKDKAISKKTEYEVQINNLNKKLDEIKEKIPNSATNLVLAGGMFIEYGKETIYAFSGMLNEFKFFQAQYLIQWEIIKKSLKRNCDIYNFYGITGDLRPENPQYGVYEFKKGFGGNVIEYLGDFDLVVSPVKYALRKLLKKFER